MTFVSLIQPYRRWVALSLAGLFLTNFLSLCMPWGVKVIIDQALPVRDVLQLRSVVFLLFGVLVARTVLSYLQRYHASVVGERITVDLRRKLYWHSQQISLVNIRTITPSQILARITGDVDCLRHFIFDDALDFLYAVFGALGIMVLLFWLNWRLAAVAVVMLPVFLIVYLRRLPELVTRYESLREGVGQLTSRINEVMQGMATVRAFGAEAHEREIFEQRQGHVFSIARRTHALNTAMWTGVEFVASAGVLGVLWLGGVDVARGEMTPGALVAFYSYLGMLFTPIIRIGAISSSYQEARASLKRINEILALPADLPSGPVRPVPRPMAGRIRFEEVSFQYAPDKPVLDRVSFSIEPGETIGIVGPSGAGKTTLVGLLLRFYDPQQGRIMIDGIDLRELDLLDYRARVGVVLQDDFLFNDSVRDNICYGRKELGLTAAVDAAHAARAHEFITGLSGGYDQTVGERGALLSYGQRQRVAIARALVNDPAILILDEGTSAVDAMMENEIQRAIKERLRDRTVIIVAHRFSSVMEADRIMVLEAGRLAGIGTHDELLATSDFYRQLYLEQFRGESTGALS